MITFSDWMNNLGNYVLSRMVPAVLILAVGLLVTRVLMTLVSKALEKTKLEKAAHSLIRTVIRTVIYVLLGLTVCTQLGINVTGVVALASVLTLAVSLALQNILANVIGGFTLLSTSPFHSGDYVEVAGQGGTVTEINMTYTVLAAPDNKIISIPNSSVVAAQITNYSTTGSRRMEFTPCASYDIPTQKVIDALLQAGTVDKALLEPAPFAAISGYEDSAIRYTLRVWARSEDYWNVYFQINQRIKDIFDQQAITMTYPHLNVHLDK